MKVKGEVRGKWPVGTLVWKDHLPGEIVASFTLPRRDFPDELHYVVKFVVKFSVKLSVRVKICSNALSAFGMALVSALVKRGTESDVQDDKEEKGKCSLGVPAVPRPRFHS